MPGDVQARPIAWAGMSIAATVAVVIVAVFLLLHFWQTPADADRTRMPYASVIPGPVLQEAPQLDLAAYRAEKQQLMDSAAWVDAQHGIARIPVADAMALLAASAPRRAGSAP